MAHTSYYDSNFGEHYPTPYANSYDVVPSEESFSSFSTYQIIDHGSSYYDPSPHYYSPAMTQSTIGYSASAFSEPNQVVYEYRNSYPIHHYCSPSSTQFRVYHSVSEFNQTDFEEYDPTPYGGGYDISATYGKPLPPSEKICYPPSSTGPDSLSSDVIPFGSIESPYGKEEGNEGYATKATNETKSSQAELDKDGKNDPIKGGEEQDDKNLGFEDDDSSSSESGYGSELQNGIGSENQGHNHGRNDEKTIRESYVPSGYGLEAMDLCETIFGGYFPCLSRNKRIQDTVPSGTFDRRIQEAPYYERNVYDLWEATSDYLFGNSNPYGDSDGRNYGEPLYGYYPYQKHYYEHPIYPFQHG